MLGCLRPRVVGGSIMIPNHSHDHPCGSPLCSVTVHVASQRVFVSPVAHHFTRPPGTVAANSSSRLSCSFALSRSLCPKRAEVHLQRNLWLLSRRLRCNGRRRHRACGVFADGGLHARSALW